MLASCSKQVFSLTPKLCHVLSHILCYDIKPAEERGHLLLHISCSSSNSIMVYVIKSLMEALQWHHIKSPLKSLHCDASLFLLKTWSITMILTTRQLSLLVVYNHKHSFNAPHHNSTFVLRVIERKLTNFRAVFIYKTLYLDWIPSIQIITIC